jgi:TPR repeat protein
MIISLKTAITLTGLSKRTLWRRILDGLIPRAEEENYNEKARIYLDSIKNDLCIPFDQNDFVLIKNADSGDSESQTDLAVMFWEYRKMDSAIYWLNLAAKKNYANAMYLLGKYYIEKDENLLNKNIGIMWIAKAAIQGHIVAMEQMKEFH